MKLMENSTQKLINSYSYDAMSRIASVSDGTNTAEYTRLSGTNLLNSVVVKQGEATKLSTTKTYDAFNRLLSTSSVAGAATRTYTYEYNDKDQRTKLTLADGTYWEYTYDEKGQVTSGIKKDSAGNSIAGQSFNYTFDDIGNRKTATEGMTGMDSAYSSNNVNQYTQRTIPGAVPIAGSAATDATVRVKDADTGQVYHTTRSGKYFSKAVPVDNTSAAKEANLEIHAVKFDTTEDKDIVKTISGKYYVAKTPQSFTYDTDGNMTSDGEWTYTYNAENRPVTVINADNTKKFEYKYDYAGRRIEEKYYTSSGTWTLSKHLKFVYQGFKKIAEYDGNDNLLKLYTWQPVDLDVPLWVKDGSTYYFYIVDGNKNVRSMVDVSGNEVASYDYKPFGGIASQSGTYADTNMYRFSSEYYCPVLKSSDFGVRDYSFVLGRWRTRDPIGEADEPNLYLFVSNNPINKIDILGMWGRNIHEVATRRWSKNVGYAPDAAAAIGAADEAVDGGTLGGGKGWAPWGDQSYHFNRNKSGKDSRIVNYEKHFQKAKEACDWKGKKNDDADEALGQLGTALHPHQDWVAHGDYGIGTAGNVYTHHNAFSPQKNLLYFDDAVTNYPDNILLDAVGGVDGRAAGDAMRTAVVAANGETRLYANYELGTKRYRLTKKRTLSVLKEFRNFVKKNGLKNCKCWKACGLKQ